MVTTSTPRYEKYPFIGFLVSDAQTKEIRAAAEQRGETLSAFIRRAVGQAVLADKQEATNRPTD